MLDIANDNWDLYINSLNVHALLYLSQKELKDEQQKEVDMKIQAAVGFRHVIDLLSSEQKLIVGHNCFLGINVILNLV